MNNTPRLKALSEGPGLGVNLWSAPGGHPRFQNCPAVTWGPSVKFGCKTVVEKEESVRTEPRPEDWGREIISQSIIS